jgi:hypothetical protein
MQSEEIQESLTILAKEPDVNVLRFAFEQAETDLSVYFDLCRRSYDTRRNYWPGKARDLRKHGADAFPWDGASDSEAHVVDERITRLVALCMTALGRANIQAEPVEGNDLARARVVSNFLKWMTTSGYIPRLRKEQELAAQYLFERGMIITYVGWHKEDRTYLQKFDLAQIAQQQPELANAILTGAADEQIISMLQQAYQGVNEKRAIKALATLRKDGYAEIPVVRRQVDCPCVKTLAPDGDWFFPAYVTDPQNAPYGFWRVYMTAQQLRNKISTDGWDADWVEYVIEHYRGINTQSIEREITNRRNVTYTEFNRNSEELIEVIHAYQRLIDEEDNAEGIYETVFHRSMAGKAEIGVKPYAKFELLNGYEDYPVVVTRLFEDTKRLYDAQTIPDKLRGIQDIIKAERDSRIDRNSMATLPPLMHPVGMAPAQWRPGGFVPYRRAGEIQFGPAPAYNPGSVEMENNMQQQADRLVGLDLENPISTTVQQYFVNKFLQHNAEVLKSAWKAFQRYGSDKMFFQVTGVPDPMEITKGNAEEDYDVIVNYDVLNSDPDTLKARLQSMVELVQLDRNGRINVDALLDSVAASIDPILAGKILIPAEEARDKIVKNVTDDLSKIFSGIEVPARPNGAQVAIEIIQQYATQPDIAARLQSDPAFAERLNKYNQQYVMTVVQQQNAVVGKLGTQPASVGAVDTQAALA